MTRDDSGLLVVLGSIASELEHLSAEVLKNGGSVDHGTGSNARRNLSLAQVSANTSHGKLQTGPLALSDALASGLSSAALAANT